MKAAIAHTIAPLLSLLVRHFILLVALSAVAETTPSEVRTLTGHTGLVRAVAFSKDGRLVASGSFDGTIRLWDVESGRHVRTLAGSRGKVFSVDFSEDSKFLLSGSEDKTAQLWSIADGKITHTLSDLHGAVYGVAMSSNLMATMATDWKVRLWDLESGNSVKTITSSTPLDSLFFSPDKSFIASGGNSAKLWDVATAELKQTIKPKGYVFSVAFSPDGKALATASETLINFWNIPSGTLRKRLPGSFGKILSIAFAPDGLTMVSGGDDYLIHIWNVSTGLPFEMLSGHSGAVWSVAVSPDGKTIASGSEDKTVRLWKRTSVVTPNTPLPSSVDLRSSFEKWNLPIIGQHSRLSCSVHTFTSAVEYALSRELNQGTPLSEEFLNWSCNQAINNTGPNAKDRGQFFEWLWMTFTTRGTCAQSSMPFQPVFNPVLRPSETVEKEAKELTARKFRWHFITEPGLSAQQITLAAKRILAKGWPVLAGSPHSVLIVGYTDNPTHPGGGYFSIRDSGWNGGVGGYSAIDYSRVNAYGLSWIEVTK